MMNPFLARLQNEAVMVDIGSRALFEACLDQAATISARIEASDDRPMMADDFWFDEEDWRAVYRPYVVKDGILHVPIKGVLLNDFPYALGSWATGYQYIWKAFERGMGDLNVKGIALVCDTPGGMVAGNFELVDKMYAMRGVKPVRGYASESAYSAGYSLISVADPGGVTVSRTGGVGSIGVLTTHLDVSGAMEQGGYVLTFIHAGKHKVDGNAYEALPDDVKARIQARIDDLYSIFVSTVARNRGMDEQAVRDTEALTFSAPDALSNGLADTIGSLDDALADFAASLNLSHKGDDTMADISQADHETALANVRAEGVTEGMQQGAAAERTRINAILNSDQAKTRPTAALACAMDTDLSVDAACAFLGKLAEEPKAAAATPDTPTAGAPAGMFVAAMSGSQNPDLTDTGGEDMSAEDVALAQSFGSRSTRKAA